MTIVMKRNAESRGECRFYRIMQSNSELNTSTDQGVDDFKFDTVDKLQSNLFSVSDYYEAGADVHLTHNGFSGVSGVNPETNKSFSIPCVYSREHKGWLVHFVVANSKEEARRHGKHIEKQLRHQPSRL